MQEQAKRFLEQYGHELDEMAQGVLEDLAAVVPTTDIGKGADAGDPDFDKLVSELRERMVSNLESIDPAEHDAEAFRESVARGEGKPTVKPPPLNDDGSIEEPSGEKSKGIRVKAADCEGMSLLDLPDVPQAFDYGCGSAISCSVGRYHGVGPEGEAAWAELLGTTPERGTPPESIAGVFQNLGCRVEVLDHMSLEDLRSCHARGWPVICCIQDYGEHRGYSADADGHWVAVIGLGMGGYVFVQDPSASNVLVGS